MGFFSKIFKSITNLIGDVVGFLVGVEEQGDISQGALLNKQSNIEPVPVIYGERRVGGVRVFVSTGGGKKNEYLYIALVLSEGEIDSIGNVYINDTLSTDSKYSGLVSVQKFTGTDSQTYSTLLAEADDTWGTNHRLRGVAYIALRLKYDQDVFSSIPEVQCVVKGRKVFDPRTSTTAWSDNPALCLRDYLTNARYGKGLSSSLIDDSSFITAANKCDQTVTQYSGGGSAKIFQCNAVINTGDKLFDNVKRILQGMRGLMPYTNGIYSVIVEDTASSTFSLNPDNITSSIRVQSNGKNNRYNKVTAKFTSPSKNWQTDSVIWPPAGSAEETTFLAEDNGFELSKEVTFTTVTNQYAARDLARVVCLASRLNTKTVQLTATSEALQIAVGDVVSVEHPSMGWTGAAIQLMRCLSIQLMESGEVRLTLQEYTASVYPWASLGEIQDGLQSTLPDPFAIAPPTNLSVVEATTLALDGTVLPALHATWDAADDAFVSQYEILINNDTDDTSTSSLTGNLDYLIAPVYANKTYTVGVRSINTLGVRSEYISVTITATGDVTPPAVPTGLVANGGYKQISLAWVSPLDGDFKHVEIQRANTAGGTWSTIGYSDGGSYVDYISTFGTVRYYRIRSVDFSNNASAYTGQVSAETDFVDSDAFTEEVQNLFIQAGLYGIEPVSSLPASGEFEGQVKYQTSDNKLYRWTGSAWTAAVPAVDITGQLSTLQIANDAITNAKIAVDAIQGDVIATNAITATKISDGSISTGKLAASAVTAAKIAAGTITASKIATGTITATQIATDTITANKIAAGAITASELATNSVTAAKILAGTITGDKITANTITGGLIAASGIITNTAQIENGLITNAKIANLAVDTAKITDLAVSTLKIKDEAVTIPISAQNGNFGASLTTTTWTPASEVGAMVWLTDDDKPTNVTIIGTAVFNGLVGSGTTDRVCRLRVTTSTDFTNGGIPVGVIQEVALSAREADATVASVHASLDTSGLQNGQYYRLEMQISGGSKTIGQSGLTVLGTKK